MEESFDEMMAEERGGYNDTVTTAAPSIVISGRIKEASGPTASYPHSSMHVPKAKTITASWSCSGASACGGSSLATKRASSISGTLPDGNS